MPKFLAYPFSNGSSAAGLILALALLATLLAQPGFFPAAVHFAVWSITVTYSFAGLRFTATGNFQPPALTKKIWCNHLPAVFRQLILYFAIYWLFLFLINETHRWVVIATTVVCAMAIPAVLILLTIKQNLSRALNPILIIELISRTGCSYFQLLCFFLLLTGTVAFVGDAADNRLPEWCRVFVTAAACNYATVIVYIMTGYVILQYHHRLDYRVDLENVLTSLDPAGPVAHQSAEIQTQPSAYDDLLSAINQLVQKGELTNAIRQIEMRAKASQINDLDLSQCYLELLRMGKDNSRFLAHAARHLELLSKSGYNYKALSLYLECIRLNKNFAPQAPVLFKIACWLDETGKSREAVYVLNSLIKYHPQNTMVPKALYRVAQIFHEGMKDAERSKKILAGLIQKFPDHEITPFARNYLNGL